MPYAPRLASPLHQQAHKNGGRCEACGGVCYLKVVPGLHHAPLCNLCLFLHPCCSDGLLCGCVWEVVVTSAV